MTKESTTKEMALTLPARIACELLTKWGMVAATPDGEDSAGRAKLRLQTPVELADRAVETAGIAVDLFKALGWMVEKEK